MQNLDLRVLDVDKALLLSNLLPIHMYIQHHFTIC